MLETMLDGHITIVLMGILTAVGIMSKCIANIALKRLIRAAGNMNKSNHPLMRLVRAKFEHVSMVSDKVENVKVFVDKYLYEYKVLGLRLHSWRRMEKTAAGLCLIVGAAGAGLYYAVNGMSSAVWRTGAIGGGLAAFVFLVHLTTDEKYQMEAVRNYMVDYLENVCLHKYEKSNQKEIKILAQEGTAADFTSMPSQSQENTREPAAEAYATRKREPAKGQSAVSAFLAAELKAGEGTDTYQAARAESSSEKGLRQAAREEIEEDEEVYQAVRPKAEKSAETYQAVELEPGEMVGAFRVAQPEKKGENIVEISKTEPVKEALAAAVSDSAEYAGQSRSSVQSQTMARERRQKKERPAEDVDRDVVIRRILEEFMA